MNKVMIMRHTHFRNFLLTIGIFFSISTVVAPQGKMESSQTLPPGFAALVPEGTKLQDPTFRRYIITGGFSSAGVEFSAEKEVDRGTQHVTIRYHLKVDCSDNDSFKRLEATNLRSVEQKAEKYRESLGAGGTSDETGTKSYPPETKKYPWGYGITQRIDTSEIGGSASSITAYNFYYIGIAGTSTFEASVDNYLGSADEIEKWIAKVAVKVAQTNITNISN
jgi:hypothetical protein